jgi:hypothetical protein
VAKKVAFTQDFGTVTNRFSASATDGTVRLLGNATTFDDLVFDGLAVRNGSNLPSLTKWKDNVAGNSVGLWLYYFPHGSEKDIFLTIQMPHRWKIGTTIYPHVHWLSPSGNGTSGQKVLWGLEYEWLNVGDVGVTDSVEITGDTPELNETIVQNKHYLTKIGAGISGSGKTLSSILVCTLSRKGQLGGDTFLGDVALLSFDFHYEIDSLGSDSELGKA